MVHLDSNEQGTVRLGAPAVMPKLGACARRDRPAGLRLDVVGHVIVEGEDSDHVEYCLLVGCGRETWKVRRRFSNFRQLHVQLQRAGVTLPRPPSRLTLGILEPTAEWVCSHRRQLLSRYLQAVLDLRPSLGDANEALYSFLDVSPETRPHIHCPLASLPEDKRAF